MSDLSSARFVRLTEHEGHFVITLLDADRNEVGFGYKGPTLKRAQQDMKYWTRDKGLEEVSD